MHTYLELCFLFYFILIAKSALSYRRIYDEHCLVTLNIYKQETKYYFFVCVCLVLFMFIIFLFKCKHLISIEYGLQLFVVYFNGINIIVFISFLFP